jgi:RNA polymerase sigma-70 factor, ECF subfamily
MKFANKLGHIFRVTLVLLLPVATRLALRAALPNESQTEGEKRETENESDAAQSDEAQKSAANETDQALAKRARTSREAFGELYERRVADIYRYVYYRVGSVEDTEDLTARVFARALKHIHNYNDRGLPFMAWLYRIAHNVVANYHRDTQRHPSVPLDDVDLETSPYGHADALQDDTADATDLRIDGERERGRLIAAIRKMSEERQQLVVLKFVQQLQNVEIGQIMGRSEGAIKSLYHRTLAQLRELMTDDGRLGSEAATTDV